MGSVSDQFPTGIHVTRAQGVGFHFQLTAVRDLSSGCDGLLNIKGTMTCGWRNGPAGRLQTKLSREIASSPDWRAV